ncbi:MAG: hypothetical protein EBZ61_08670 [Micrococcales bacterium]|nr:hypothetical protein [Micrococcales bacterium]
MPIYWFCDNKDCFANSPKEQRPHKSYRRKQSLLDDGRLDEDDELVVFSEVYGHTVECENCGSLRRPELHILRFDWDDPPGDEGDSVFLTAIEDAVAVYQRNGWYPKLQRRLF